MLIGLCGAAGAGKDTVARRLFKKHGFFVLAFADPLYDAVAAITGIHKDKLRERDVKDAPIEWLGRSPRELLQTLGTEWGRNMVADDIWIKRAMKTVERAEAYLKGQGGVAITDVRFDNEAQAIRSRPRGVVWRVERPGNSCLSAAAAGHASEAGVSDDLVDAVIQNTGTVADLDAAVDAAIARLLADTIKVSSCDTPRVA